MEKIGKLTVIDEYKINGRRFCKCLCDCGTIKDIRKDHLGIGKTVSCGCFGEEQRKRSNTTHGMIKTRLYTIWLDMKQRCTNPKNTAYLYYGAKGISVCELWSNDFLEFYKWAMKSNYNELLTIDRIDSEAGYTPQNCRWITRSQNTINAHLGKKYTRRNTEYGK